MKRFAILLAAVCMWMPIKAYAQCGSQRVVDPTNAFLGSNVGVSVQGGGCANGQCAASSAANVSALQAEVRALQAQIAASRRTSVNVYAAPARIASYQAYGVPGGGSSASASAGGASSSASASANRAPRALYVVPSSVYAMDAAVSASSSASAAVDVVPEVALVPLNATDVQVAAGGGCGGGGRFRFLRPRSRSRSVSVSVARN